MSCVTIHKNAVWTLQSTFRLQFHVQYVAYKKSNRLPWPDHWTSIDWQHFIVHLVQPSLSLHLCVHSLHLPAAFKVQSGKFHHSRDKWLHCFLAEETRIYNAALRYTSNSFLKKHACISFERTTKQDCTFPRKLAPRNQWFS